MTLFGDEKAAVLKRYTESAEAYELFLKGRYHAYKYTAQGWTRAIEFFEKAIEVQPDYAPAYAGIAVSRGCLWVFGIRPAEQMIPQCKAANRKALAIDAGLAEAYLSLAIISFFHDWDWPRAEQEFVQSITLKAHNAEALSYYAMFLAFNGRADDAIRLNRDALKLDPLAPLINMNGGWTYFIAGMLSLGGHQIVVADLASARRRKRSNVARNGVRGGAMARWCSSKPRSKVPPRGTRWAASPKSRECVSC